MQCPACPAEMSTIAYEGIPVEACPGCQGHWLDADELTRVVQTREISFTVEEKQAFVAATKTRRVALKPRDRNLICPSCRQPLKTVNYAGDSGILIDRCAGCKGIWLDSGELEVIQLLVESWNDYLNTE